MAKILLNSYPRTGMSFLGNLLRVAFKRNLSDEYGEYSNREDFFLWSHTPVMLLGKFDGIAQITIVRDPIEVIPSLAAKLDSGIGLSVHDSQITYHNPHKESFESYEEYVQHTITSMSDEFLSYLENTLNNFDDLIVVSFDDVVNDTKKTIDFIMDSVKQDFTELSESEILIINDIYYNQCQEEDESIPVAARRMPVTEKPQEYYDFKDALLKSDKIDKLVDAYGKIQERIILKQSNGI